MNRLFRKFAPKRGMLYISGHGHHRIPAAAEPPKGFLGKHYHWIVAAVLFLSYLIYCGLGNNLYSFFVVPVTTDLQVSRGAYTLGSTFAGISGFFSGLFYIEIYRRVGHRIPAFIAFLVYAGACVAYSFAKGVVTFYVFGLISGFFGSFVTTVGISQIISNWFHKYHGTVLGVIFASSGIGGALFAQIHEGIMEASSWRTALLVQAGALVFAAILVVIFIRNRPERMGLHPLGYEQDVHPDTKHHKRTITEWRGEPFKGGVAKKPAFWLLVAAFFLCTLCCSTLFNIVPSHVRDQGMSSETASQVHSVMLLALAGGKILVGFFCDRFPAHKVVFFLMLSNIAAALLLATVATPGMAILAVIVYAPGLSFSTMMPSLLATDLFGTNSYARAVGILVSTISLAAMVLTPLANYLYDLIGSYTPLIYGIAASGVLVTILFVIIGILGERDKKHYLEEHEELQEDLMDEL